MGPEFFSLSTILAIEFAVAIDCMDQYLLVSLIEGLENENNQ